MAKLALTIREVRDHISKRLGVYGSSDWEGRLLEVLNESVVCISAEYDWEFLRGKTTVTTTDATGIIELPEDVDRILSFHQSGQDEFLTKVSPLELEIAKEDSSITVPTFWTHMGYVQSTSSLAPVMRVEIYTAPSAGASFVLWYVKHIDEFLSDDIDTVPNIPPHIWSLIRQKTIFESMKYQEVPATTIRIEENTLIRMLESCKKRERLGSTKYGAIRQRAEVASWYKSRMG